MSKYFDKEKWSKTVKHTDWYLRLSDDYKKLLKQAEESRKSNEIKDEIYKFFEDKLEKKEIALGQDGQNWDEERKPIDTIIIHHTKNHPGITWKRLNAIHLVRLYATYYSNPTYDNDKHIKGQPIYSNHFRNNEQVFYTYHWIVRIDGSTERLLPDNETGWHCGNWEMNCRSVGICLDGNFENSNPPEKMLKAVSKIIKENYNQVQKEKIFGHREINIETTCPGNLFLNKWKQQLIELV